MKPIGEYVPRPGAQRTSDPYAGGVMSKHGWFSFEELGEVGALTTRDVHGNRVVQFPVAYPGGRPVYREIPEHKLAEGDPVPDAAG